MATDPERVDAIRRELIRRELERRKAQSSPIQQVTSAVSQFVTNRQADAKHVLQEAVGEPFWQDMAVPHPLDALGMAFIPNYEGFYDSTGHRSIQEPIAHLGNQAPSEATRLLGARAYQGMSPFAGGDAGNQFLESMPQAQRGAVQLDEQLGSGLAGTAQFGGQILGALPEMIGTAAVVGGNALYQAGKSLLPQLLRRAGTAGGATALESAVSNALGAAEGERANTFVGSFDPRQPENWLAFALGAAPAAASTVRGRQRANADTRRVEEFEARRALEAASPVAREAATIQTQQVFDQTPLSQAAMGRSVEPSTVQTNVGAMFEDTQVRGPDVPTVVDPRRAESVRDPATRLQGQNLDADVVAAMSQEDRIKYVMARADEMMRDRILFDREGNTVLGPDGRPINMPRAAEVGLSPLERAKRDAEIEVMRKQENEMRLADSDFDEIVLEGRVAEPTAAARKKPRGPATPGEEMMRAARMQPTPQGATPDLVATLPSRLPEDAVPAPAVGVAPRGETVRTKGPPRVPNSVGAAKYDPFPEMISKLESELKTKIDASKRDPRTVEPPGDPLPQGGFPKNVQVRGEMADAAALIPRWHRQNAGIWDRLKKAATLPEQRAAGRQAYDAASTTRSWESAQRLQDVQMGNLFPKLRKAALVNSAAGKKMIDRFIAQHLDPDRVKSGRERRILPEELPQEWRLLWEEGVRQNTRYRDELIKAGMFDEATVKRMLDLEKEGWAWLHRDYRRFLDKDYVPRHSLINRALDWIEEHSNGRLNRDQSAAYLQELIASHGQGGPRERFRQSRLNKEILKQRKDIPGILRDVLGEIHDGPFVLATSMSEVERLWRQYKVSESIVKDPTMKGTVWDDTFSNRNLHPNRVWIDGLSPQENRRNFGEFAGKYVAPELFEALMEAPAAKQQNIAFELAGHVMQVFKFSKVGLNPVTWMRDAIGNMTSMAAAGLPIWNSRLTGRTLQAMRAISDFGDSFKTLRTGKTLPSRDGTWMQWALEDGALRPGMGAEFAGGSRARAIAREYLRAPRKGWGGTLDFIVDKARLGAAHLGEVRELADTVPRLSVYIEQVTKGVERLGLDPVTARARASRIVNENFISAGNIGHGVRELSRFAGVMNPFMSWYADAVRVHTNWIRNAAKPAEGGLNSGMGRAQPFNVLMHYGMIAGVFTMTRYLFGMSDQEVAAGEASLKTGYQRFHPFREWLPGRDEKGRPMVMSLSAVMPTATFFQGDPTANPMARIAGNMMLKPFEGGLLENDVTKALSYFGMAEKQFERDPIPGNESRTALENAWNWMSPGLVSQAWDAARRAQLVGELRKYEEPLTTGQALSKLTPFPVEPVGPKSIEGERQRINAELVNAKKLQSQINRATNIPEDRKQELRRRARDIVEELQRHQSRKSSALQ